MKIGPDSKHFDATAPLATTNRGALDYTYLDKSEYDEFRSQRGFHYLRSTSITGCNWNDPRFISA